jgi:hypothetical protein
VKPCNLCDSYETVIYYEDDYMAIIRHICSVDGKTIWHHGSRIRKNCPEIIDTKKKEKVK